MSISTQSIPRLETPPEWLVEWRIGPSPILETATEHIFLATHRTEGSTAWLHRIVTPQSPAQEHFSRAMALREVPGFAPLIGWGLENGRPAYLTHSGEGDRLDKWKLRRQMSSATTIRMRLMLQTVQTALWVAKLPAPKLQLDPALATVMANPNQATPYQLQWHGWLPSPTGLDAALMAEAGRIMDILTAGMPWPIELTRAFHDPSLDATQRLERCEKILLAHLQQGAAPDTPATGAWLWGKWQWAAGIAGILGVIMAVTLFSPPKPATEQAASPTPTSDSDPSPTFIETPPEPVPQAPPPPAITGPTEASIARTTLDSARVTNHPATILRAARALLKIVPDDAEARKTIADLLHREARHQIDLFTAPTLTSPDGWGELAEAGFEDARLLMAVESWATRPSDATLELQAMADAGSTAAMVMLGQLAANGGGQSVDPSKAFRFFQQAAAAGDPAGNYLVAECLLRGKGTAPDPAAAIPFLRKAAEGSDVRAMDALGSRLVKGDGVDRNFSEAADLFRGAIANGYVQSLANLAVLYLNGEGVPRDFPQAMALLERGEKLDDPASLNLLGTCAEQGLGMNKDLRLARTYHERAAKLGSEPSKIWLAKPAHKDSH